MKEFLLYPKYKAKRRERPNRKKVENVRERARKKRERYKYDLYQYFLDSWHILEPGTNLLSNWHLELICEYLMQIHFGVNKKLLINIAPRHLKSTLCSVVFPTWQWLYKPYFTHLCISYSTDLANDLSDKRRKIIQSKFYSELMPDMKLSSSKNRISEFENNFRGTMYAKGLDTGVTGVGGIGQIYDDPNNPRKADSEKTWKKEIKGYKNYSVNRRNDPQNYYVIVIQQRVSMTDVSDYIYKNDKEFTIVDLPTEAEKDETIIFPITGKVIERKKGDYLHPERFGEKEASEAKKGMGTDYSAQYQQRPVPAEGNILKKKYWARYLQAPKCEFTVWAWDTAFKKEAHNDNSSGVLLGVYGNHYYVLDVFCDRMETPEVKKKIISLFDQNPTNVVLIEDKASGISLYQDLKRDTRLPMIPIKVDRDKIARVKMIAPTVEAGKVMIPYEASWVNSFLQETSCFPDVPFDDQTDAFTHGLHYLISNFSLSFTLPKSEGTRRKSYDMKY